jgi:hypothetical protein
MSPKLKKLVRWSVLAGLVVAVGLQLVPVKGIGSNPKERYPLPAPPEVVAIMRKACLDCHSNETEWPIYSRIAPGSWLMARDINNGRKHLNFSEWADTDEEERTLDLQNCWSQVEAGEMPPWFYVFPFHPKAKLNETERATLKAFFMKDKDKPKGVSAAEGHGEPTANANAKTEVTAGGADTAPAGK